MLHLPPVFAARLGAPPSLRCMLWCPFWRLAAASPVASLDTRRPTCVCGCRRGPPVFPGRRPPSCGCAPPSPGRPFGGLLRLSAPLLFPGWCLPLTDAPPSPNCPCGGLLRLSSRASALPWVPPSYFSIDARLPRPAVAVPSLAPLLTCCATALIMVAGGGGHGAHAPPQVVQ